jgi:hypothetical protein
MRKPLAFRTFLSVASFVVFFAWMCPPVLAQWSKVPAASIPQTPDGKPNLAAPAPRLPDGRPDLSGVWNGPVSYLRNLAKDLKPEDVQFQPWAKALYDERAAGLRWKEDPDANCLPQGTPKILFVPAPWRIVQTPGYIVFVYEAFNLWRQVFADGRELAISQDITPTWFGYSVGRWEGETLVVESRGFNGKAWLDQLGKVSTDALHVIERFRRRDFGHLEIQITIDDPKAYMKPWTVNAEATLLPDTELMEFICLENEKDTRGK